MSSRRKFLRLAANSAGVLGAQAMLPLAFPDLIREALAVPANNLTGTLADVEHVVIFMQENRAFDHYFGSLQGVRGFADPRAITLPSGKPVWYQPNAASGYVLPFHFDAENTSALSLGTNHSWKGSQQTWQGWDAWVKQKTAQCMGYFDRHDIPFYYALADAFTICDAYHCSVFGATDPNRMYSLSGTNQNWFGSMGSLYNINAAGFYNNDPAKDNISAAVTASAPNWSTYAEILQANQISWKVYQEWDNYGDNYLAYFKQFRVNPDGSRLRTDSPLYRQGRALAAGSNEANSVGTDAHWLVNEFAEDVRNNRLPAVSWICAPNDYTEHSPNSPNAGENLCARLLAALVANPQVWSKTVFLLTYDENDGFFDHMPPNIPPLNANQGKTTLADVGQYENYGGVPVGLGPRVPLLVISPWSKGGRVCSQVFDHTSKLRFLEQWLSVRFQKRPEQLRCPHISPWRRTICGDLTSAFDFAQPDATWPQTLPQAPMRRAPSGKPYPQPPAQQSLPRQEPGPSRVACALPYALAVDGVLNNKRQLSLSFINRGQAGAGFIVYSSLRSDGPWYYAVEAGKQIEAEVWNWSGDAYDLRVHGPQGFLRAMRGGFIATTSASPPPQIFATHEGVSGNVRLRLFNPGLQTITLEMTDNAYGQGKRSISLSAGQNLEWVQDLSASNSWYDFSFRCSNDAQFLWQFAGHVESGKAGRTDPVLGKAGRNEIVCKSGIIRSTPLAIEYGCDAAQADSRNWVGVYGAGAVPGKVSAHVWAYAPSTDTGRKSLSLDLSRLAVGDYSIWYLYQNGYQVLAGPLALAISDLVCVNPHTKQGTALELRYAVAASKVKAKNWVGIWSRGSQPGQQKWLLWQYAAQSSGSLSFATSGLGPGQYEAWLLYDDGYVLLGGPLPFSIV